MNSTHVDLDINNYTYEDLLQLFHLEYDFGLDDMKRAKKDVLMTHPDKSRLDNKYFLFYSKAYKLIYQVYEFRKKSTKSFDDDYSTLIHSSSNQSNTELIKQMNKQENFSSWFNRLFDKYYDKAPDGHGDWLASTDNVVDMPKVTNMGQMNEIIEREKQSLSEKQSLINYNLEQHIPTSGTSLYEVDNNVFSNENIFSKFQYEDVKKAHEETLIPVSHNILNTRMQYKDADHLSRVRQSDILHIPEKNISEQILKTRDDEDTRSASHRAFVLAKQEETSSKKTDLFWSQLKMLQIQK